MAGFQVDGQDSFISKLSGGGARASLFDSQITLLGDDSTSKTGTENFTYACKGIQIPPSTVGIVSTMFMGRAVKLPGNRSFDDITTTVLNDEGYALRNKIESWMHKLNSHFGNVRDPKFVKKLGTTGYTRSMLITTRGKEGAAIGKWELKNCWPSSLDQIDVNWEPNDAIMEYSVTWAYDYWIIPT
tara:strand:+ start:502 stop:1059 length:558 start_codon:yes stop_codon:yes gene_type:complete